MKVDLEVTVDDDDNSPATGQVTITGTLSVGQRLTATSRDMHDDDGLTNPGYTYQWQRDGVDIPNAMTSSHTLVDADLGKRISVKVTFTDDAGNMEMLESIRTAPVTGRPPANTPTHTRTLTNTPTFTPTPTNTPTPTQSNSGGGGGGGGGGGFRPPAVVNPPPLPLPRRPRLNRRPGTVGVAPVAVVAAAAR